MNQNNKTMSDLEKQIFELKLKSLQAFRNNTFIVEINNKTVSLNAKKEMVLTYAPLPTEFQRHEVETIKSKVYGANPVVTLAKEWYLNKLAQVKQNLFIQSIIG